MNLPDKVKGGDTLTASYLNSIREALKDLEQTATRRRLLSGTGYAVKESAGGSSLCIDNQAEFLRQEDELTYSNVDFTLRIKPEDLCEQDEDGNWDMILQVHKGDIRTADGNSVRVESLEEKDEDGGGDSEGGGSTEGEGEDADETPWDDEDWVDLCVMAGEAVEVWVKFTDAGGDLPSDAVFCIEEAEDNCVYIPIGQIQPDTVNEEETCFFINQYQLGTIELGSSGTNMPFDARIVAIENECADMGVETPSEYEGKYYININEGRVFLPEARYAVIPAKENFVNATNQLEVKDGYLILELVQDSSGNITYQYRISDSLEGTQVTATEQ